MRHHLQASRILSAPQTNCALADLAGRSHSLRLHNNNLLPVKARCKARKISILAFRFIINQRERRVNSLRG
jgi:hypothetical protein